MCSFYDLRVRLSDSMLRYHFHPFDEYNRISWSFLDNISPKHAPREITSLLSILR